MRGILAASVRPTHAHLGDDAEQKLVERGGQILKVAVDFDALEAQGTSPALNLNTLRGRPERYDAEVLEAFAALQQVSSTRDEVREVALAGLRVGMSFVDDVRMCAGQLLAARGFEVTRGFLERARNFRTGMVKEPIRVLLKAKIEA